jgi:hypothetical protein
MTQRDVRFDLTLTLLGHPGDPPFNLLRCAVRNPSQCLHMLISDDRQPVALFLSRSVRDRPVSRTLARHEMSDSKTPTRFAKVILRAGRLEKGVPCRSGGQRFMSSVGIQGQPKFREIFRH